MATLKMASMIKIYFQHGTISEEAKWTLFSYELIFFLYLDKNLHGQVPCWFLSSLIICLLSVFTFYYFDLLKLFK